MCLGPYLSAVHLLPALDVPVVVGRCLCASRVVFFLGAAGLLPCCCWSVVLVWLLSPFLSDLGAWVLAVWPALSWPLPPSLPPWLSSGAFWSSQSCWSLPPDIWLYLQRSGCHTFGMACRGWLARVFPPLHGNKGFGPVWGFALSTMLWVLFMCPSLRHWGIRPRVIQNPLRTPLKLYAPTLACAAFSLLPLLPSLASALSLFAGLRLPSSPRALALFGPVCPPRCPLSWLVFLAPPPSWIWFGLLAWPGFCLVGFVWFFCVLVVSGCFLFFASCVCWLRPTSVWTGTFVYFAFTCTNKALIDHCTCVSVRRLDRFTCTVEFHRSTTSYFKWLCVTIRWVLRWLRMAEDCRPQQYTHAATLISSLSPLSVGGWLVS